MGGKRDFEGEMCTFDDLAIGEAVGRVYGEWMIPMAIIISNLGFREPGFSALHRLGC